MRVTMNTTGRILTAPFTSTRKELKRTAKMKNLTPNCTVTEPQHILIWVRSCFILAFIIWFSFSRHVIGQFQVHNLPYGPHFQKPMLIYSHRSLKLEKFGLKKVIICL